MRPLRSSPEPVVVIDRHQDEFPPAMLGDFDWFSLRLLQHFCEPVLELKEGKLRHGDPTYHALSAYHERG